MQPAETVNHCTRKTWRHKQKVKDGCCFCGKDARLLFRSGQRRGGSHQKRKVLLCRESVAVRLRALLLEIEVNLRALCTCTLNMLTKVIEISILLLKLFNQIVSATLDTRSNLWH